MKIAVGAAWIAGLVIPLGVAFGQAVAQSQYRVNGVPLGGNVVGAPFYTRLTCEPSSQYPSYQWCSGRIDEPKQGVTISASVLHSADGTAAYLSRFVSPAPFGPADLEKEVQRLSTVYGQQGRITRQGNAALVTWGPVRLTPLAPQNMQELAAGRPSGQKGFMIDFVGNFRKSAEQGLPVFKLSGEGVAMSVNFDRNGNLRMATANSLLEIEEGRPVAQAPSPHIATSAPETNNSLFDSLDPEVPVSRKSMKPQDIPLLADRVPSAPKPDAQSTRATQSAPLASTTSDGRSVQIVVAQGIGSDVESAAKNAAENALKQVVGTFIDAEQQIKKRTEISEGIRAETKTVQSSMREYSQGTIQSFEVIGSSSEGSLVRVDAKVGVRVDDFKAYIKKYAQGEQTVGSALFPEMATELNKQETLEALIFDKIEGSINKGEVQDIIVGAPQRYTSSTIADREDLRRTIERFELNPAAMVAIPVTVSLRRDFQQNLIKSLEATAIDRISVESAAAANFASNCLMKRPFEYSVGVARNRQSLTATYSQNRSSGELFNVYGFPKVNVPKVTQWAAALRDKAPDLQLSFLDREGNPLKEFLYTFSPSPKQKHFYYPPPGGTKPWSLVLRGDGNCTTVIGQSDFHLLVELDVDTIRQAAKTVVKFVE
ncbi:hypothetical protein [Microvirga calopogonii]|uniref:hypothetical protein n=1 Tax=Microvirga calopogonii TaxID=2078013 RepID=UPI000E0D7201|nr:hypothetical protein [Microvirga calopogonii]